MLVDRRLHVEEPHNATPGDRMLLDVGKNLR